MATHNVDMIIRARDQATGPLAGVNRMVSRLGYSLLAYFGARQIIRFGAESVKLFQRQEQAVQGLTNALANLGQAAQIASMERFASQMQKLTTYGDEVILEMMKLGVTIGGLTGDSLQKASVAAIGLSKSLNMDLETAMQLISRAAQGQFGTFTRYGVVFKENATAAEKYAQVLQMGAAGFRIAQGETETMAGGLSQLSNAWGDAKEKIGSYLGTNQTFLSLIQKTTFVITNFGDIMDAVWTSAGLSMVRWYEQTKYAFTVAAEYGKWFWDNLGNLFQTGWNFIKTVIDNMSTNLARFFVSVWQWLKGEGWDFEWTGLLEGFESTLSELPKIAARQKSGLELALEKELGDIMGNLGRKWVEQTESTFDAGAFVGGAGMGGPAAAAVAAGGASRSLAAREFRTTSIVPGSWISPADRAAIQTEKNTRESLQAIRQLARAYQTGNRNKINVAIKELV